MVANTSALLLDKDDRKKNEWCALLLPHSYLGCAFYREQGTCDVRNIH